MSPSISYGAIAHLYDSYVITDFDLAFFLEETQKTRGKVLELACGTGRLSMPLLRAGIDLTCVDYSEEMLEVFRKKLKKSGLSCQIFNQDMADLSLPDRFDLIFIPFHSFSEILDESKQTQALASIRHHMTSSGYFICTLHNPIVRSRLMDGTTKELGRFPVDGECTLIVSTCFQYDERSQTVSGFQFYDVFDRDGGVAEKKKLPVLFCLPQRSQFEKLAEMAGFKVVHLYGDYERSAFDEAKSPFMIWVLEKANEKSTY